MVWGRGVKVRIGSQALLGVCITELVDLTCMTLGEMNYAVDHPAFCSYLSKISVICIANGVICLK